MLKRAACFLFLALPVWAETARIEVRVTPANPSLSDRILVEVNLIGAGPDVILRPADIPPDCVAVQSADETGKNTNLTLDPLKPGVCRLPQFRTRCLRGTTEGCDVRSAETVIPIGTVVTADPPDIRDSEERPVELKPRPTDDANVPWLPGLLVALAGIAAGAFCWVWRKRRRDEADIAERCLSELSDATPDGFHELVIILREYLDRKLTLGAGSQSSPELIAALKERSLGDGWTAQLLEDFLSTCDRAKFAGGRATPAEFANAVGQCRTLIQSLEFDITRRSRAGL